MRKLQLLTIIVAVILAILIPGSSSWFRRVVRDIERTVRIIPKIVTCTESVCTTTYSSWQPGLPSSGCRAQVERASHHIKKTVKVIGQCRNRGCGPSQRYRTRCNCPEIVTCQWANWGSWTGNIKDGACATQTRTRVVNKSFRTIERDNNCNGINTNCLGQVTSDSRTRTFCRCQSTRTCARTSWTPFYPLPAAGKCAKQTSRRSVRPIHDIIQRENNCHGITSTCSLPTSKTQTLCSCPYKECALQSWSSWATTSRLNSDKCPIEERKKVYTSTTKHKDAFNTCNGVGPTACPNAIAESRDKQISCGYIAIPADGSPQNGVCTAGNSRCSSICQMKCNKGYTQAGHVYATCNKHGKWDRKLGTCRDHVDPQITCPLVSEYETLPNKNYSIVTLPSAFATDNTGLPPTIAMDQSSPMKVIVHQPRDVIYKATDNTGNQDSCKINIVVVDTDPPKVVNCPEDMTITPPAFPYPVIWKEPEFLDNVDGDRVLRYPTHYNGQEFSEGTHRVRILARDRSDNNATCEFVVQVSKAICPTHDPPRHGSKSCNIHRSGKNETYVCSVKCDTGHYFPNLPADVKVYDFYLCGVEGGWRGQDKFDPTNPFFVKIPRPQRPWPECAKINAVTDPGSNSQTGSCVSKAEQDIIKQEFITSLQTDPILSAVYCQTGSGNNCLVSNVIVTCDSSNEILIDFKPQPAPAPTSGISSRGKGISGISGISSAKVVTSTVAIRLSDLNRMKSFLAKLAEKKNKEKKMKETLAKCSRGSILLAATATTSGNEECLVCPIGTYHDVLNNACLECPIGKYQSDDGQTECLPCAVKFSTVASGSKNETDCKAICYPGSHSPTGLSTCLACKLGFYQPLHGQKVCLPCPSGKKTAVVGAGLLSDCV